MESRYEEIDMSDTKNPSPESCDNNCASCPSGATCQSAAGKLPPKANIDVRHVILVLSGKGGVGKSTVAVNLAYALSNHGNQVGLLDLDIHGPNIPKMLGIEDHKLLADQNKIVPVRVTGSLQVVSMAFLLPEKHAPVIWRGAMKAGAIKQFLEDTAWGSLDYLVVDLPPGTGDEALTIAQLAPNVRGAVIVTTPQEVSTLDSTKAITFVEQLGLHGIGVIENMSGLCALIAGSLLTCLEREEESGLHRITMFPSWAASRLILKSEKQGMRDGRLLSDRKTLRHGKQSIPSWNTWSVLLKSRYELSPYSLWKRRKSSHIF
jgi:Mrp family chromosome partitioning ATPase